MDEMVNHPYSPKDLQLPGYVPISFSSSYIVGVYGAASILLFLLMWIISGRCSKISMIDRFLMFWWAFTGLTHLSLEGYLLFSPEFYKLKSPFYLAELWKEYGKGDSRYVARDSTIVALEGITVALGGPASLLAVYAIGARKPYSYLLQFAVSLSQLYGTTMYFVTALLEGDNLSVNRYYYWSYFVVANSFWVVIPILIAMRCWQKITQAFSTEKMKQI